MTSAADTINAARSDAPFLVYADARGREVVRPFGPEARLIIGREDSCDVSLSWDDRVSRTHAVLERLGQVWTIEDDGLSRNGTYVNGSRVTSRRRLADADVIRLGETVLRFRSPGGADGATHTQTPAVDAELSPTQRRVLVALCRPKLTSTDRFVAPASNADIARELFVSVDTVKTHMRALFDRFDVGELAQNAKRAKLAELAMRTGIVTERDL